MSNILSGTIRLPADAPSAVAAIARIEVRDTSFADAPSTVVAQKSMRDVTIRAGGIIPFTIEVPEVTSDRALSLRVHISLKGDESVRPGDLLTVESVSVPKGLDHVAVAVVR
jgi:putative lipoprotein